MLSKLIKHNLKPIFKSILPFAILFLASIIFFNLTEYTMEYVYDEDYMIVDEIVSSEINMVLHGFANFMLSCSLILLVASTIKAIWKRFKVSFYSDEAYLTHTLPVSRRALWNAQILSILITFVSVIALIVVGCFILMLTEDGQRVLDSLGLLGGCAHCVGDYRHIEPLAPSFYLSLIFIIFAEFLFMVFCGLTGIILKNRFGKNISLLSGTVIYLIGGAIILLIFMLISNLDDDILDITSGAPHRTPGFDVDTSYIDRALLYIGSIYACYCIALYFIDWKLLKKGINLD